VADKVYVYSGIRTLQNKGFRNSHLNNHLLAIIT